MKQKKCKICNELFTPKRRTTEVVCSPLCAIEHATNLREAKEKRDWDKRKAEMKENLKTHSDYCADLQKEVNAIVRLIDKGSVCISSLKPLNDKYDAGHRFSTAAWPSLRFNLLNIHAQSVWQNQYNSGNPDGYDHGLESIYGLDYLNEVHNLKQAFPTLKITIPELQVAINRARKIRKGLNDLDLTYSPQKRIELRKLYNKQLGIYK